MFFDELGLPAPDRSSSASRWARTARRHRECSPRSSLSIDDVAPDAVLVYGDTNSTLAGALAGAQAGVPVAHVEAGMRSFDRSMPEELNRVLTDHASSLLLCSSEVAVANLAREGRRAGAVELVGDVMVDVALDRPAPRARARRPLRARGVEPGAYVPRDRPPRRQRGRPRSARAARRAAARRAGAGRVAASSAHPRSRLVDCGPARAAAAQR